MSDTRSLAFERPALRDRHRAASEIVQRAGRQRWVGDPSGEGRITLMRGWPRSKRIKAKDLRSRRASRFLLPGLGQEDQDEERHEVEENVHTDGCIKAAGALVDVGQEHTDSSKGNDQARVGVGEGKEEAAYARGKEEGQAFA